MAEFGENLKRVREEKGITQQTLADYLYVTRQAISRWEGGSRYPDLMTAKKMAQYLGISLDELLSDEDMKLYAEKNAIMESSTAKKWQMILFSIAFMSSFTVTILQLCNYFLATEWGIMGVEMDIIHGVIMTLILGYGTYAALSDKLNGKVAGILILFKFGSGIMMSLGSVIDYSIRISTDANAVVSSPLYLRIQISGILLVILMLVICLWFYNNKRNVSPMPVYIVLGVNVLYEVACFVRTLYYIVVYRDDLLGVLSDFTIYNIFSMVESMIFLMLIAMMTYVLNKKRKLAARVVVSK